MNSCYFKLLRIALALLILNVAVLGQFTEGAVEAEPEWKYYRLTPFNLTVMLPKLPVTDYSIDRCANFERHTYAAYADDVVYTVNVTSAIKEKAPKWCDKKIDFGPNTINSRIGELIILKDLKRGPLVEEKGSIRARLSNDENQVVVIDDLQNGRFIDLAMTFHKGRKIDSSKFFGSINLGEPDSIVEVENGSPRTIGDKEQKTDAEDYWEDKSMATVSSNYRLIHRPKPGYTDAARKKMTEGTVRLRVVLLKSGGVGQITPVTELPHGLTEQAIFAAQRMVFLPKKVNGLNQSVIVTVEYGFSIY